MSSDEKKTKTEEKKARKARKQFRRYLFTGTFITLTLVAAVFVWKQFHLGERLDEVVNRHAKQLGPDSALVKIVEYSDFQCPVCRTAQPILKEVMQTYGGKVQLEFRHFPLSSHKWAPLAHQAAECANQKGKFWEYHDLLYDNQAAWSRSPDPSGTFVGYAQDLGMDTGKFVTCLKDGGVTSIVNQDSNSGNFLQVGSTPTFLINNTRIVGVTNLKRSLETEIARVLREKSNG